MSPIVTLSPSWSHGPRLVHLVSFRGVAHPTRAHHNPVLHAGEPSRHEPDDDPIALIAHHHGAMTARPLTASRPRVRYLLVVVPPSRSSALVASSELQCHFLYLPFLASSPAQPSPVLLFTARRGEDSVKRVPRHISPCLPDRSALLNFISRLQATPRLANLRRPAREKGSVLDPGTRTRAVGLMRSLRSIISDLTCTIRLQ